jgi:hypothetical protein
MMIVALLLLAQDKWLFEDKFTASPGKGYQWVRPDAAAVKVEKGALHLKALPGTMWEKSTSQKNLLTRALPKAKPEDGPLAVEALVTSEPGADGELAGVAFYENDDKYVLLARGRSGGKLQTQFVRELGEFATLVAEREETAVAHRLRIRWEGQKVSAEILPAGSPKWVSAGYCESPFSDPTQVKVALVARGDGARWARFSDFRVGHPAPIE